jgi:hypothetical protein
MNFHYDSNEVKKQPTVIPVQAGSQTLYFGLQQTFYGFPHTREWQKSTL